MSLLDDASLLVTPNAEKATKLYSIIPANGNGDFSVTRATTATRVNAAGLVELVPYNLLQYSERFSMSPWSLINGATIAANTTTAPDGTLTADTLTFNGTAFGQIQQASTRTTGDVLTFSLWIKSNTFTSIDLYIGSSLSSVAITSSWQRVSITKTLGANDATPKIVSSAAGSVDIWGAQLVQGTSALDYQMTETRLNIPRLDYSLGSCPNILLEPQRTNVNTFSEQFSSWTQSSITITSDTETSPSGIVNADTLSVGVDAGAVRHRLYQPTKTYVIGTSYTATYYLKAAQHQWVQIIAVSGAFSANVWANFNLATGTIGNTGGADTTASIESVGNGWYRCRVTGVATGVSANNIELMAINNTNSGRYPSYQSLVAENVCYVWGAQLEAGAYATSYIPTTSASVTRNADVISRGNIFTNGLVTASGGTWFVDLRNNRALVRDAYSALGVGDSTTLLTNALVIIPTIGASRYRVGKYIAGVYSQLYITTSDTAKIAIKWNGATADVFENGVKVVSATAFTTTIMQNLSGTFGVPTYLNSMALFPTPLTDTQCIALTT
jgi:hypothetical protein